MQIKTKKKIQKRRWAKIKKVFILHFNFFVIFVCVCALCFFAITTRWRVIDPGPRLGPQIQIQTHNQIHLQIQIRLQNRSHCSFMAAGWVVGWLCRWWFSGSVGGACVLRTCQPQHKQKTEKIVCKDFFAYRRCPWKPRQINMGIRKSTLWKKSRIKCLN